MKTYTKKYYIGVCGVNDLLHDVEVPASLYWKMLKDSEELYQDSIKPENKEDSPDYVIEKDEYVDDFETVHYVRHRTCYTNGCSQIWYTRCECKEGYVFNH